MLAAVVRDGGHQSTTEAAPLQRRVDVEVRQVQAASAVIRAKAGIGDGIAQYLAFLFRHKALEPGVRAKAVAPDVVGRQAGRSEERRVGKECVRTCRSGWSPYHYNKKKIKTKIT